MRIFILFIIVLISVPCSYSQEIDSINCDKAQTQYEMTLCAQEKSKRADNELYELEKKFSTKIEEWQREAIEDGDQQSVEHYKELKSVFSESQKKWIEYRDAYCKVFQKFYRGTMMSMQVYAWRERLTSERIALFKSLQEEYK